MTYPDILTICFDGKDIVSFGSVQVLQVNVLLGELFYKLMCVVTVFYLFIQYFVFILFVSEKNNLLFIETSALDSTNVESAFQQCLTGLFLSVLAQVLSYDINLG